MKLNDSIDMKGRLTLRLSDRDGNLVREIAADNDIVLTGRDLVAKMFAKVAIDPISHIAVGTGTTAVAPGTDTALNTEVFRKPIAVIDPAKDITAVGGKMRVVITTELDNSEPPLGGAASVALTEAGMFNAATGGVMYNRVVFPAVNKTADFKLTLVWEILF
jgi:hypothetical protein